jgi:hypothetical protein
MFLSDAQLNLISTIYEARELDILKANISVASALIVRGIVATNIARKKNEFSTLSLTEVGEAIADSLDHYIVPPKYRDVLDTTRRVKYGH